MLTREAILAAEDLKAETVSVPEWGGDVRIRMMTGTQRDAFAESVRTPDGKFDATHYRAKLLAHCIVDDSGAPMFSETDVAALNAKSSAAIDRVFAVADRLNSTGASAVEDAVKN